MVAFPYRKEKSDLFGETYRPIAAVHFVVDDETEFVQFMYVDSGADVTLVPKSVGELLGFSVLESEIKQIYSVSRHSVPVIIKGVKLKIGGYEFEAKVAWCLNENVPLLLGRLDVFDK